MTKAELKDAVLADLGETADTGGFYTATDAYNVLDRAQQLFAFATLCIERTAVHTLTANTSFEPLTFADLIVPFTVRIAATGKRLDPATLEELTALNQSWLGETSAPTRYGVTGWRLLHCYPKQATAVNLSVLYAAAPVTIPAGGPEIPVEYHPVLAEYAVARLRIKEGETPIQRDVDRLRDFWGSAKECADRVRNRCQTAGYDMYPPELTIPDFSRVLKKAVKRGN